jgi:hypothetical protein
MNDLASAMTDSVAADGQTAMTGNLNLNSNKIVNLATPTLSNDAVTKAYADALVGGAGSFTTLSVTGVTTVQAGTVSAPAITTTGDTNTGIYFPAADTIGLTVGGVESARVVSGLLSIPANSTAPSAVRLYEDTDNGTNYVDFIAPSAITSNRTLTIPDETGTIITTASSGQSIPSAALPVGSVLQVVNFMSSAVATGTTTIPQDDTIPQNTEGTEFMTLAITPTSASSNLRIDVVVNGAGSATNSWIVALFQDSTVNAIAAINYNMAANNVASPASFTYYMTSGTTSSTTFKVRAGLISAGTYTFNGQSGGRLFGGVMASSITITEIAA